MKRKHKLLVASIAVLTLMILAVVYLGVQGPNASVAAETAADSAGTEALALQPGESATEGEPAAALPATTQGLSGLLPTATPNANLDQREIARSYTWVSVTTTELNVRSGPNVENPIVSTLAAGACLPSQKTQDGWHLLGTPEEPVGWSHGDFLSVAPSCAPPAIPAEIPAYGSGGNDAAASVTASADAPDPGKGIVDTPLLNVRAGPGVEHGAVGQVEISDCVEILENGNGWLHIRMASQVEGWASADFIRTVASCPADSRAAAARNSAAQPVVANAYVVEETYIHECFAADDSELRTVKPNTPVKILGTGQFVPPIGQFGKMGTGPFVKVLVWDEQTAWLAADAVSIDLESLPQLPGQC